MWGAARTTLQQSSFFHETYIFRWKRELPLTRVVICTTQFPLTWPKRFWNWEFRRGGRETLSGTRRNPGIVTYEYREGSKRDTRQDPEREPSWLLFLRVGQEPHKFQSQVFGVLSKLQGNIRGQEPQGWRKYCKENKVEEESQLRK